MSLLPGWSIQAFIQAMIIALIGLGLTMTMTSYSNFQTKDYVFPIAIAIYVYVRNAPLTAAQKAADEEDVDIDRSAPRIGSSYVDYVKGEATGKGHFDAFKGGKDVYKWSSWLSSAFTKKK
jgi:hypothetical protein